MLHVRSPLCGVLPRGAPLPAAPPGGSPSPRRRPPMTPGGLLCSFFRKTVSVLITVFLVYAKA
ncbi:hypothetical protein ASZ90_001084 [hydrocarbon metagenome]|uniref:Uncharacterized protein n=1 Tax=hydrocarbon metagenome TaxID=938273 RepID=A0A0W8G797_9ZZZZ